MFSLFFNFSEHFSSEPTKNVVKQTVESKPQKRYLIRTKVCGDCEAIKSYLNELNDPSLRPIGDLVEAFEASLARELSTEEIEDDDDVDYYWLDYWLDSWSQHLSSCLSSLFILIK